MDYINSLNGTIADKLRRNLFIFVNQVVYAMGPKPPFSKRVLPKIKIMTDGRGVDVISGNFS